MGPAARAVARSAARPLQTVTPSSKVGRRASTSGLRRPGPAAGADEVRRAVRERLRDLAAIVALADHRRPGPAGTCSPTRRRLPSEDGAVADQGPGSPTPGRDTGPGPDGAHGGVRWARSRGDLQGRPRHRDDGPRPELQGPVHTDATRAAAPEHRPQGHVRRAATRDGRRRRCRRTGYDPGRQHPAGRRTRTRSYQRARHRHARLPQAADQRRRQGLAGPRQRPPARSSRRFEPDAPRPRPHQRRGRRAPRDLRRPGPLARTSSTASSPARTARSPGSSAPPPPCSARSLARAQDLARAVATCRARCARPTAHAEQGRSASRASCGRRPTSCARGRARSTRANAAGAAARRRGDADRPRARSARSCASAPLVRDLQADGADLAGVDPRSDAHVHDAQPLPQPRRLQPERPRGPGVAGTRRGLPVLARLGAAATAPRCSRDSGRRTARSGRSRSAAACTQPARG